MQDIKKLAEEFKSCQKILLALGDENRQHLILEMMQMGECGGVRVGAITERTNLSRPAVSIILGYSRMQDLSRCGVKERRTITISMPTAKQ